MKLSELGAPQELVNAWAHDLEELTAVQEAAVKAGILDGHRNMLVVAPTSSGKTLVGEMAAAQIAMAGQKHVFMTVPMKALAEEQFTRLRERYDGLMHVVISTGERLEYDDDIRYGNFDLAVLTYEKLAALIIQTPGLLRRCGCVVVDEGQMIADSHRGAQLEILITQILLAEASPRLVVLSASLDELNQLHKWLKAEAVVNADRPVPLVQAVCSATSGRALVSRPGQATVEDGLAHPAKDSEELAKNLALSQVGEGRQVIVFRSTVPGTRRLARAIADVSPASGIDRELNARLLELEDPDTVRELADFLACGVAFHNADLSAEERRLIEAAFRAGQLRVLVSTTTLAMGVNMPADTVIVVDSDRPVPLPGGQWSSERMPVADWRNAAGRAGRLGIRTEGLAVLLAADDIRRRQLFNQYVLGDVDAVESQIPKAPLHDVVFRLLAGGVARTEDALVKFLCATFAYQSFYDSHGGPDAVRQGVVEAVKGSIQSGLVVEREGQLLATEVARSLAGAGVSLSAAIVLKSLVDQLKAEDVPEADLLHSIARLPESGNRPFPPRGRKRGRRWEFTEPHAEGGWLHRTLATPIWDEGDQQAVEQTACLLNWCTGQGARELHRDFEMTRERLNTMGGQAAWLLQTLARTARVGGVDANRVRMVQDLALQAEHGLPTDLTSLSKLKPPGVSRENLMGLREKGITDPDDLLEAEVEALQPALSPGQIERFRDSIQRETELSLRRKRHGHVRSADEAGIPVRLIETLYSATGAPLEEAVRDAFEACGFPAKRIPNQPHGQEDIQVATPAGTVVVAATGSESAQKPIKWTKAQQVMGQGVGLNPVNCICVGRPRFEGLAQRNAQDIAREGGDRKLLLLPVDVLVEAMLRRHRDELSLEQLAELLADARGVLSVEDLPMPPDKVPNADVVPGLA
jgi:ATP-dependent DNA helicase